MNCAKSLLLCLTLCWVSAASAQGNNLTENDNRQVLRMGLYPPDLLMRQQEALGIDAEQRSEIAALVQEFQGEVTELQWSMPSEQQKLRKILSANDIDTELALAQAAQVLEMESQFKLAHFELLIAIKNQLTDEQITMLNRAIKRRMPQRDQDR
ncbi:MAG: periplasmic heavy metal sensor [Pseudomonadota bacterium]